MIVAIHQPNFLPWLGYFHKLVSSDIFVFLDNVQYSRGKTFTNRVAIKTSGGQVWLKTPVVKNGLNNINQIKLSYITPWKRKHLKTLEVSYKKAYFFSEVFPIFEEAYGAYWDFLADFNIDLITRICSYLGVNTRLIRSSQISTSDERGTEHIMSILTTLGATKYLSGTGRGSARYNDADIFREHNIELMYQSFVHPVYKQQWRGFIPKLSIVDLLFNCGKNSLAILQNSTPRD